MGRDIGVATAVEDTTRRLAVLIPVGAQKAGRHSADMFIRSIEAAYLSPCRFPAAAGPKHPAYTVQSAAHAERLEKGLYFFTG